MQSVAHDTVVPQSQGDPKLQEDGGTPANAAHSSTTNASFPELWQSLMQDANFTGFVPTLLSGKVFANVLPVR